MADDCTCRDSIIGRYKLLVMDVDGIHIDGKIYMEPEGEVFMAFDVKYAIRHIFPELYKVIAYCL